MDDGISIVFKLDHKSTGVTQVYLMDGPDELVNFYVSLDPTRTWDKVFFQLTIPQIVNAIKLAKRL